MLGKKTKDLQARKSIMIVDDDEAIRSLIGSYFSDDYDISYHKNGLDAMLHIRDVAIPDFILLDMEMPDMNGRVFLRRLKYVRDYKNIPVIFISSVKSQSIINSMIRLGIKDYLVKPFDPQELIEKVKKILQVQ